MGARRPTISDLTSVTMGTPQQPQPQPQSSVTPWFLEVDDDAAAAPSGHYFLDECRMCGRHLPRNRDIYMYKGDTPFCSEDCREDQIRLDESKERANQRRAKAAAAGSSSMSAQIKSRAAAVAVRVV